MKEVKGNRISKGIAIGKLWLMDKHDDVVSRREIENTTAEIARYENARNTAICQLTDLGEKAVADASEEAAAILRSHVMLLRDESFREYVCDVIERKNTGAEYAILSARDHFAKMLADTEDDTICNRAADIRDVSNRLLAILNGVGESVQSEDTPVILVAEDFVPSDIIRVDREKLLAIVSRKGSVNSHTAILARAWGIPALTGVEPDPSWNGKPGIVDGDKGVLIVDPEEGILAQYRKKIIEEEDRKERFFSLKGKENRTKSGRRVEVFANINHPSELASLMENDAGGVGLFRSEFLYLESDCAPTEKEQFEVYKKILEDMDGKKVIIRTLDIGAEKQVGYLGLEKEENPAMGFRSIRFCLSETEVFRTQLRALFRASAYGNLSILYPMIVSVEEVRQIRAFSREVREELLAEGVEIGGVKEGIMIETPAAAVISDLLAKEVDFFSIGTNDLIQFTLAVDRQNEKLNDYYKADRTAVLRLIQMAVDNAHKAGIRVGICGELAADLTLTELFLQLGVDVLSVPPSVILPLRERVRDVE
ncbi:MAG: phosphoenolpyruvate--protein phosphotransferase [Blautia sp.]|nr:phosphoenolpyruvate--protein phosphotransferase [Blautia sp.]